ncbi:18653_t:CDS:2 [Gigaspora margarita]|uniref:18653_t:CDS:1 n=1 Tax=Gigaspora margarita TaxID=4874 RepID=A0ABN7V499_GIGMA|nr:18653_t:CDS:2 [Gigaspora margarita]
MGLRKKTVEKENSGIIGYSVALKSLKNSLRLSENFLEELKIHLQCQIASFDPVRGSSIVPIYGITYDPKSYEYMVMLGPNPQKRPTTLEIKENFDFWRMYDNYDKNLNNVKNKELRQAILDFRAADEKLNISLTVKNKL